MNCKTDVKAKNIGQTCMAALKMSVGTALTAAAFGLFIIPQNFASAGVTGLASVVFGYTALSLSQMVLAINSLFLALGFVCVGKGFAAKTVASSLLFPLMLQGFSHWEVGAAVSPAVCVLLAGTLLGVGTGLLLNSGASSGGFAILGVLLQNKWRIPVAATLHVTDAAIILMNGFRQPIRQTVCGILVITLSAVLVGGISRQRQSFRHRAAE